MTDYNSSTLGINDPGIDELIRELSFKSTAICEKISKLKGIYTNLNDYCSGAKIVSDEFLNNLDKTKEAIEFNIDSYSKDLRSLQTRLHENDKFLSTLVLEHAAEIEKKANSIDSKTFFEENRNK